MSSCLFVYSATSSDINKQSVLKFFVAIVDSIGSSGILVGRDCCSRLWSCGFSCGWFPVGKRDADVGTYQVNHVHHVPDVPETVYLADDQSDLVLGRHDPRVARARANRVRDVHLVAFDLGVQFLERWDSFNRIARHSFGFPAFQPHALGNPHSLFAGAHQRFMRTSSGQSIAHSTTVVLMKMWTVSSLF